MPTIRSDEAHVSIIPTSPPRRNVENPPSPPNHIQVMRLQEKRERDKQRGDLSGSFIYCESLVCSLHFGTQVLNSAVGTLLPHLSYLTPRMRRLHTLIQTRRREASGQTDYPEKQDRQAGMKTAEESITDNFVEK